MNKLIVILGPTSSGKSSLAIRLARKFHGEIISADSRQIYKGMDIGTGKVTKKEQKLVPHHLLDVANPKKQFSVDKFKSLAKDTIVQIVNENKLPFLVGGTAFYIYAVIDNLRIPEVKPNLKLRNLLRNKSTAQLFAMLKKLDPARAKTIDAKNPRRLIRAIEIVKATGSPIPELSFPRKRESSNILILGIKKDPEALKKLIHRRVKQRFQQGLIAEIKKLLRLGLTLKRLKEIGLTYKMAAEHLVDKSGHMDKNVYNELINKVARAEYQFSRHQMTWFKRDQRIHWIRNQKQAERLVQKYLH
jgi:tRNA dimethylallyltransferase